jgi:hypothetical protein
MLDELQTKKEQIVIPAPVYAEFLVFAGKDGPAYQEKIKKNSVFRIEPFGELAAIELAMMELTARSSSSKRGSATTSEWQKVKIDRQIVAVAKVCHAVAIYSNDEDVSAHAKDWNIKCVSVTDLPAAPQGRLNLEPTE